MRGLLGRWWGLLSLLLEILGVLLLPLIVLLIILLPLLGTALLTTFLRGRGWLAVSVGWTTTLLVGGWGRGWRAVATTGWWWAIHGRGRTPTEVVTTAILEATRRPTILLIEVTTTSAVVEIGWWSPFVWRPTLEISTLLIVAPTTTLVTTLITMVTRVVTTLATSTWGTRRPLVTVVTTGATTITEIAPLLRRPRGSLSAVEFILSVRSTTGRALIATGWGRRALVIRRTRWRRAVLEIATGTPTVTTRTCILAVTLEVHQARYPTTTTSATVSGRTTHRRFLLGLRWWRSVIGFLRRGLIKAAWATALTATTTTTTRVTRSRR